MWQASARPAAANSRMLCACLAAAIASAACATSGGGGAQTKLLVTTEPAGATLFVNGANMGPTPVTLPVKPEERSLALRLAYEGYRDSQVTVTRRAHGHLESSLPLEGEPIDRGKRRTQAGRLWPRPSPQPSRRLTARRARPAGSTQPPCMSCW